MPRVLQWVTVNVVTVNRLLLVSLNRKIEKFTRKSTENALCFKISLQSKWSKWNSNWSELTSPKFLWTLQKIWQWTKIRFIPEVKLQISLSSLWVSCIRALKPMSATATPSPKIQLGQHMRVFSAQNFWSDLTHNKIFI